MSDEAPRELAIRTGLMAVAGEGAGLPGRLQPEGTAKLLVINSGFCWKLGIAPTCILVE
jgi:hypothetical protein